MKILIYIGGAYQLLWALCHIMFPKQFDWKNSLAPLDAMNRISMLIFSKLLLFFYLGTALIVFLQADALLDTDLGTAVLIFLSLYWLVRAVLQVQYFGFKKANSLNLKWTAGADGSSGKLSNQAISFSLFGMFLVGCALFLIPVLCSRL